MPFKIIHTDHFEILGKGYVLLTAPHATGPEADLHTGEIVEETAFHSKCYAVVGKVSREFIDLNRAQAAQTAFRRSIDDILEENGIRYILDIHGKKDAGVEIGTALGETASESTTDLVRSRLAKDFAVVVNKKYVGLKPGSIVTTYAKKNSQGQFLIEAVQIELGHEQRHSQRDKVVNAVADLVGQINRKLGFLASD